MNGVDFQIEIVQDGIAGFSGVQVGGGRELGGWRIFLRTEKRVFELPSLVRMRPE